MLSDPAMWLYLLDPELLALIVIVGLQYSKIEVGIVRLTIQARLHRRSIRIRRAQQLPRLTDSAR
jgi:hypothetical protein